MAWHVLTFQPFELAVVAHDGLFNGEHPNSIPNFYQVLELQPFEKKNQRFETSVQN